MRLRTAGIYGIYRVTIEMNEFVHQLSPLMYSIIGFIKKNKEDLRYIVKTKNQTDFLNRGPI